MGNEKSKADYRRIELEAQVPAPSAATGNAASIGNIGRVSGNQNPTVVGAGQVIFHYNSPPETAAATRKGDVTTSSPNANPSSPSPSSIPSTQASGVPAPRPQHSQRPDQEPRPRAPSYQDVGNKTRDILKGFYKTSGSYVQLLHEVDNDQKHIAGIYTKVQLETREGVAVVTTGEIARKRGQKGEIVNSTEYDKIFRLRTRTGELITRLIFVGMGGVGKSTIFDRIAYDWADEVSKILKSFKLVFRLKMFALSQESNLVDSFDQLLDEDSGIAKDELDKLILANPNEVLILLDGFDEMMTKTLNADSFGSILKALNRTKYRKCVICVSTRPSHLDKLMSKSLVQNPCTHIEVLGFTDDGVNEYVRKFYDDDPDSGNALIQTIELSNVLHDFAKNPMLLMLMCSLWRENNELPETLSRIFTRAVEHMFKRKDKDKKTASGAKMRKLDVSKELIAIGKTALRGLMRADQKFSFQEDEFEPNALDLALKAGILTKQSVIKNSKSHNSIYFMHKTVQEYCAAKYLQSLNEPGLLTFVKQIKFRLHVSQLCSTIEGVVSNEFLFRFCCGDNERCMTHIVNLLNRKFNKDEPRYQSDVVQVISRNCFFESQSEKAPRCLTRDSQISSTIKVDNNNDFRSLIYLLEIISRSESPTKQLSRVETIEVSRVSSGGDLAVALGYMENLRNLRLYSCSLVTGDLEKTLKCHKLLTDLCIKGDSTLGGRAVEWAPHIKHLTSLNKLEISYCELQVTDIEHIASSVSDMPNLTVLILAGNTALGRSAEMWAENLSQFTYIQTLNLRNCTLQWTDIEHIAWAVGAMPSLTDLILTDNPALGTSTEKWSRYLLRVKQKHTLDLSNFSLTWEDIDTIFVVLDHIPVLTNLNLTGNTALGGSAKMWAKNLSQYTCTKIQTLNLSDCSLQWTDIEHIASVISGISTLTNLSLAGNTALGRSAGRWAKDLSQFTYIQMLNLRNCSLQWTDIEHIASAVGVMPSLTDLILTDNLALGTSTEKWSRYLLRVKQKHTLDLSNSSLTWEDIDTISVVFDRIPALTNLNLTGNTALGRSANLWAKNLLRFTNIQTLNLSNCTLQWTDIEHIASALSDMPALTDLSLAGNTALGRSAGRWAKNLSQFTYIQTLNLSNCTLQWTDIEHIAWAVGTMPSLTGLILTDNPALCVLTEEWSRYLLRVKQKHTLDLSNSSLTWEDIDTISVVLYHIPALTTLNLTGNTALGGSAEMWAKILLRCTTLQTLNLSNCTLQLTDIEHIASVISDIPTLTNLNLTSNTALGRSANLWAKNLLRFTNIQMLNLSNCTLQWTDIEHIALALSDMPTLTNLSLAGNTALGRSAGRWAKNLSQFTYIQMLNLSNCTLQWTDIEHIASAVGDMPRLTDLWIGGNRKLLDALISRYPRLRVHMHTSPP